ncbi:MAG: flippase [Bacteroidota bacterium]
MRKWLYKGSYALAGNVFQLGFAFLTFLILVRILSPEALGTWVLYMLVISIAEMARQGFVQQGMVKYGSEEKEHYKEIVGAGFFLQMIISLGISILLYGLAPLLAIFWKAGDLLLLFRFAFLYMFSSSILRFIEGLCLLNQDYRKLALGYLIYGILFAGGIAVGLGAGWERELFFLLLWQSASFLLTVVCLLPKVSSYWKLSFLSKKWTLKLFQYGKYTLGNSLSSLAFQKTDVIMLGTFLGPGAVACYNVATKICTYMEVPLRSAAQVLFPNLSNAYKEKGLRGIKPLYIQGTAILIGIIWPIAGLTFLFAEDIILLLAGEEYGEAKYVLYILLIHVILKPIGNMMGTTLDAVGRPQVNFTLLILSLGLNLLFNYLFIPMWGIAGAAIATVSTVIISLTVGQIYTYKQFSFHGLQAVGTVIPVYRKFLSSLGQQSTWERKEATPPPVHKKN